MGAFLLVARGDAALLPLDKLDRVEPTPGHRELGMLGELRSTYVSNHVLARVAQDRQDGVHTPFLGGRSWAEEIPDKEEEPKPEPQEQKPEQPQEEAPKP